LLFAFITQTWRGKPTPDGRKHILGLWIDPDKGVQLKGSGR
jgi:hypothetical protein